MGNVIIYGQAHQPHRTRPQERLPHTLAMAPSIEESARKASSGRLRNWTEVIYHQCYSPLMNGGPEDSAYRRLGFSFTPVLLRQLKVLDPQFVQNLRKADKLSAKDQDGHGNALAVGFDHTILPLALCTDREIQIAWAIEHFKHTYGRPPEGFWLPEAAVDLQTLQTLYSFGINFVVLSPFQAEKVNGKPVHYEHGSPMVDVGKVHRVRTKGEDGIHVFLYNPFLAQRLAFTGLLNGDGSEPLEREIFFQLCNYPSFVNAAVDLETFSHHKERGVANLLAYLRRAAELGHRVTNYGRLLAEMQKTPEKTADLELYFPSAWSCAHGVGRWSTDCGCEGSNPWREPLRLALNELAKGADTIFDQQTAGSLRDPKGAKIRYIQVLLGQVSFRDFLEGERHTDKVLPADRADNLSSVFDSLVSRQAMFVSCAWFFRGMRIEVGYAIAQAADLIRRIGYLNPTIEWNFVRELAEVNNLPDVAQRENLHNAAQAYFKARSG